MKRRILLHLSIISVVAAVAVPITAPEAAAVAEVEEHFGAITVSQANDGQDFEYAIVNGLPTLVATHPLGTLGTSGAAGQPNPTGMKKLSTHCFKIDSGYTYGYHCLHIYKPGDSSDGDPNFDYIIAYWTGSSKAKCCNDLKRIRDGMWKAADAPAGMRFTNWRPNGTSTPPESCASKTVTVGLTTPSASGSISSTFQSCSENFGPYAFSERDFGFQWVGERDHEWVIGMGGGAEFKFPPSKGWKLKADIWHKYCTPDWAC